MHEYDDIYYTYWFDDMDMNYRFNMGRDRSEPKQKQSSFDDGNAINMTQDATGAYVPEGITKG